MRRSVRAALAAEALLESAVGVPPGLDQVLPLKQPEGAAVDPRLPNAASVSYLELAGLVTGGWMMARAAQGRTALPANRPPRCGSIT